MPTKEGPDTNRFRCEACGRYLNTREELESHRRDCVAAQQTGATHKVKAEEDREGEDREWVSTP